MPAMRVALSNDYVLVLRGVEAMLAGHADQVEVVALTADSDVPPDVDVVLYDTFGRLPRHDEKLRDVVALTDAQVIVYSWDSYPPDRARAAGAAGYLHKGLGAAELVEALIDIHEGRTWETRDPHVADDDAMPVWPGQEHGLSARESEVFTFMARGLSNAEIAAGMFLGIDAVKAHLSSGYTKIGVSSRSRAIVWALRHGFEPDAPEGQTRSR
jgi:DNA-binding NarL/FixJ family response regulator